MSQTSGDVDDFGMDTISPAGALENKPKAMREAGFSQVKPRANDLVGHDGRVDAALQAVEASGVRGTGLQVLRDFEGLAGQLHHYPMDITKAKLATAHAVGVALPLACSSTSQHASRHPDAIARDLRKPAVPMGIKVAYEGLSWGRTINELTTACDVNRCADAPSLGLGLDSFHACASQTSLDDLELLDVRKVFLVQLADFMWQEVRSVQARIVVARHFRVFPPLLATLNSPTCGHSNSPGQDGRMMGRQRR